MTLGELERDIFAAAMDGGTVDAKSAVAVISAKQSRINELRVEVDTLRSLLSRKETRHDDRRTDQGG